MDFETGKLHDVAKQRHPSLRREHFLFWTLLIVTTVPYAIGFSFNSLGTAVLMLFMAYFQVLATVMRSSGTSTSHYMRFLLSGSNPIGMTGGSSLLFGAVDAIFDWREDTAQRRRNPVLFYVQTLTKFAITPIGVVMLLAEFAWDVVMLRHPRLFRLKWNELFSLAEYHDVICPEKSNDIFYADLAISRYCNDPYLYQWNRMRALVFELQQYLGDATRGMGVPDSNLLLQTDIAAYQSLKRLCTEQIEIEIRQHYDANPNEFPFPTTLANRLIKGARPTAHYVAMRQKYLDGDADSKAHVGDLHELLRERYQTNQSAWKVLRLMDTQPPYTPSVSAHVSQSDLNSLAASGVLQRESDFEFRFTGRFQDDFRAWFESHYAPAEARQMATVSRALVPDFFVYQEKLYVRKPPVQAKAIGS